jgi:hypothetical protein
MQVRKAVLRAAGAAMVVFAVAPWIGAGGANADGSLPSGDPRATSFDGNVTTCADVAGLAGDTVDVTSNVDETNTYLNITAIPSDVTVTGVVVKGANGYNVYLPGALPSHLGDLPWLLLHAPINASGSPATLSHYFACGTVSEETITPPPSSSPPPPPDQCTNIEGNQETVPAGYIRNADGTCSPVSHSVTTTASVAATTASQQASVLPTKKHTSTPTTSVLGTKAGSELPHTGNSLPVGALVVISLGLLAGGGALVAAPAVARSKKPRRH